MTRPFLVRLHRAGPWLCSTVILLYVALSPVIFVTATGDQWLWRWILAGVPVVGLALWLAAMAYEEPSAADPTPASAPIDAPSAASDDASEDTPEDAPRDAAADITVPADPAVPAADDSADHTPAGEQPIYASIDPVDTPDDQTPVTADSGPTPVVASGGREAGMRVAMLSLSRKVQASAHRIQEESTRMVAKFPAEPDVLEAGMRVDHAAAQQARMAQSIATLCGEQPGQHWRDPLPISDVVHGAAGRITAYRRIRVEGDPPVAVQGAFVEPLIHLVAELLANATQSSPPATDVLVRIRSVRRGAALEIDDAGVGMDETNLAWMREIATGTRQVRLPDLGEIPQTGLAVVGTYVRRHGFRVDLTESVHGGLRVAVLVPEAMTAPMAEPEPDRTAPRSSQVPPPRTPVSTPIPTSLLARAPKAPPAAPAAPATPTASPWPVHQAAKAPDPVPEQRQDPHPDAAAAEPSLFTSDGLPQRRSKRGQRAATGQQPAQVVAPRPEPTAEQAGAWMGSFLSSPPTPAATTIPAQHDSTTAGTDAAENHWRNDDR